MRLANAVRDVRPCFWIQNSLTFNLYVERLKNPYIKQ